MLTGGELSLISAVFHSWFLAVGLVFQVHCKLCLDFSFIVFGEVDQMEGMVLNNGKTYAFNRKVSLKEIIIGDHCCGIELSGSVMSVMCDCSCPPFVFLAHKRVPA